MSPPILPALKESGKRVREGTGEGIAGDCDSWANDMISLHHSLLEERCKAIKSPAFKVIKENKERQKMEMTAERPAQWQSTCPDG